MGRAEQSRKSLSRMQVRQLRCCPVAMAQKAASNDGDVVTGKARLCKSTSVAAPSEAGHAPLLLPLPSTFVNEIAAIRFCAGFAMFHVHAIPHRSSRTKWCGS